MAAAGGVGHNDDVLGSGKPTYHGLLVASVDMAPLAVHWNIGYTRNRADPMERRDLYHASGAPLWTLDASWRVLLLELAADTNVDMTRSAWPAVARVGAIYTVKRGFDIDIGYQTRLNRAAASEVLLVGVTARWGPWRSSLVVDARGIPPPIAALCLAASMRPATDRRGMT